MKNANPVLSGSAGPCESGQAAPCGDGHTAARFARERSRGFAIVLAATFALAGLASCGDAAKTTAAEPARKTVADFFPIRVGDKVVRMQLAVLESEQERGLMHRRDLGPDQGMLFVYTAPRQMRFWMRNTPTPLDIGFFDPNGVLLEIYPMQPFDESGVGSRSNRVQYPLEMNQGWFRENGVRPGAKLDLKALAEALKARGFDPRKFGGLTGNAGQ